MKHLIGWSYFNCRDYVQLLEQPMAEWRIHLALTMGPLQGVTPESTVVVLGPQNMYSRMSADRLEIELLRLESLGVSYRWDDTDQHVPEVERAREDAAIWMGARSGS